MRLPPLNSLRAFEAAARHEGFIAAAEELCVTRGAVSRHVKLLEDHLGVALFRRHSRGVALTRAGRELLPVLTGAFGQIGAATERLSVGKSEVRIICPPATSIRWLIPHLDAFRRAQPDLRVRLTTDFYGDGYDFSEFDIGFSVEAVPGRRPGVTARPLFPVRLSPACAPRLLDGAAGLRTPEDLQRFPLLHETAARTDWTAWLEAFPVAGLDLAAGDDFANLDMATRAAVMGAGVVMADLVLCRHELDAGLLVQPFPQMVCDSPQGGVCLIAHEGSWGVPAIRTFAEWMERAAAQEAVGTVP